MIEVAQLPAVNAILNATALTLLMIGFRRIRSGNVTGHKRCMIGAFIASMLFLGTYLTYRFIGAEKKFAGQGIIRPVYFFILITHVTLAAAVPFLATRTLYLALRGRFDKHRRIARLTWPIWVYVSVTGILVYLLLFHLYRG